MAALPEGRYRWWDDGHPPQKIAPRPQPARDCAGRDEHVHIHIHDANAGGKGELGSRRKGGDQGGEEGTPQHGPLLCRIRQDGRTEEWTGNLADEGGPNGEGTPLIVTSDPRGGLLSSASRATPA
jgi:hypothetical protein